MSRQGWRQAIHPFLDGRGLWQFRQDTDREEDAVVPVSPCGFSKLMAEIMLRDASAAHRLDYVILRVWRLS
jgi:UDP-glucose 4-epimerase